MIARDALERGRDSYERGAWGDAYALLSEADREASTIADRFGDLDLTTFCRLARGRALIYLGQAAEGGALLDEAMVAVTTGEVSPIAVGAIYCAVIDACQQIWDLRRAQEWTTALS